MTEHVIRPNRHSHPSRHGCKVWPTKKSTTKIWPKPKKIDEPILVIEDLSAKFTELRQEMLGKYIPVTVDPAEMGVNPDEENARDEEPKQTMP
jgi:hypothetical protein